MCSGKCRHTSTSSAAPTAESGLKTNTRQGSTATNAGSDCMSLEGIVQGIASAKEKLRTAVSAIKDKSVDLLVAQPYVSGIGLSSALYFGSQWYYQALYHSFRQESFHYSPLRTGFIILGGAY